MVDQDLTGKKFGQWTVLQDDLRLRRFVACLCKCDCMFQTERIVEKRRLLSGQAVRCSKCGQGFKDITGKQFGYLKVLAYIGPHRDTSLWRCECTCGHERCEKTCNVASVDMLRGRRKACRALTEFLKSKSLSKGTTAVAQRRFELKLTGVEMAERVGHSRRSQKEWEIKGKGKTVTRRVARGMRKYVPAIKDELQYLAASNCGYCHKAIVADRSVLDYRRKRNKTGLLFCDYRCSARYKFHGAMPLPEPVPFGATVPAIRPRIERAVQHREADLWKGMDKVLRESPKP